MEQQILFKLQFDMSETTTYRFLERYSKIAKADSVVFYLAQYLTELALLDSNAREERAHAQRQKKKTCFALFCA